MRDIDERKKIPYNKGKPIYTYDQAAAFEMGAVKGNDMTHCTNCNCELPEGAKFCPECGAPYTAEEQIVEAPASEVNEKNICEKCGLELPDGAKFCSVCGGKAIRGTTLVAPTKPVFSAAASTGGMMGSVSAEILEEPEAPERPAPSVLPMMGAVSDVPEVSEAPVISETASPVAPVPPVSYASSVPQPVNSISQPVSASQPISASPIFPSVSGTAVMNDPINAGSPVNPGNPGNAVNAGNPVNTLPDQGNAMPLPAFNAVNSGSPKKKMGIGAKIGIIAGSLAAAAAVAAGVFFAVDKSSFLSTVLGKEKYAVMVESDAIKNVAERLDSTAIADGVEAASSVYATMASLGVSNNIVGAGSMTGMDDFGDIADVGMYSGSTARSSTMPMMYGMSSANGFDAAGYLKTLNEQFVNTYGVNSASMKMSMDVEFGDAVKALSDDTDMDALEELLNNTELTYDIVAAETAASADVEVKLDNATVDYSALITENGEMYIALPFVSEKAFLIKVDPPAEGQEMTETTASLQLDKAEVERIIKELVEAYLMNYKDAAIEMEKGSMSVAGVSAEGKEIVAEFKGKALNKLFEDMANVLAKDDYLSGKMVEYLQQFDEEFTREDYEDDVLGAVDFEYEDSDKLIITSIIDKQGNVLARSFKAVDDGEEAVFSYTFQDKAAACEMVLGDEGRLTVKADILSETDCNMAVNIEYDKNSDEQVISMNLSCTGVKTEQFCGKEMPVGTYVFSMQLPEDFEDQLSGGAKTLAAINDMKLTLSSGVSGETANSMVKVDLGSYGTYAANCELSAKNGEPSGAPNNVIDLTSMMEDGMPDTTTEAELKDYMDEFGKAYEEKLMPFFEKYESLFGEAPEFTNPFDEQPSYGSNLTREELLKYMENINDDMTGLSNLLQGGTALDADMSKRIIELIYEYNELYAELQMLDEEAEGYAQSISEAEDEYWALYIEMLSVQNALDGGEPTIPDPVQPAELYPEVDINRISKMEYTELQTIMDQYNVVFGELKSVYESSMSAGDPELKELFDTADYAYMDVEHDWEYFYDTLKRGTLSINLLNSLRSALKEYVPAVQELADAMDDRGMLTIQTGGAFFD